MRQRGRSLAAALLTAALLASAAAAFAAPSKPKPKPTTKIDPALLAGMKARAIGPAAMSGRIGAIEGVPSHPEVLYVGAATGGLWKSVDAGLTWKPIFDREPVHSIGAIAIDPTTPDDVWVGTGEAEVRNSISVGNGVYRSLDGGRTWTHLGLDRTAHIGRIVLDPGDPDVAYVAALGEVWGENPERGVFKTTDGGKTWKKVLYVDERTGAADLVMDPTNPRKLFAALWDFRRWPWSFRSGGPGSGLYVTEDGGASWKRLTPDDGLPEGIMGRIGLAVAPSDPQVVYALIEGEKEQALYRSDDGGASFHKVGAGEKVANRPFYYSRIRVDPGDPNRIYSLWSQVSVSNDGGKSFETLVPRRAVHPDHHAIWIDPHDPTQIVEGNDGGVYISRDRGRTWRFVSNLPLGQLYHVRVDDQVPYHVLGGMQDNGSWRGPSAVWTQGGIRNQDWQEVGFGDGFDTVPVPGEPHHGFSMSQEGHLMRWDLDTGERKDVRPAPPPAPEGGEAEPLRFNWNAAIAIDPFDPHTLYFGSQFVHKTTDLGETWTIISPDLTTNNPEWQKQGESGGLTLDVTGAENFTTIVALAPSPVERGTLWAGTDDGRIQVTRDGGATWTSVEKNLEGVPAATWVPQIEASPHDAATAFVVLDDHRRANLTPYLFETTDYGASWKSLVTPDIRGYALSIRQDRVDPNLLFLGTEFGLWVSLDGGASWIEWTHGVPTCSVMGMAIQPREDDLVLGTHGRSVFILDDIQPLREVSAATLAEPVHLFPIPDAIEYRRGRPASSRFPGSGEFAGENDPYGALITFSLHADGLPYPDAEIEHQRKEEKRHAELAGAKGGEPEKAGSPAAEQAAGGERGKKGPQAEIRISDAAGEVIRTFEAPVVLGVNRAVWDLARDAFKMPPREDLPPWWQPTGPAVVPGTYHVTVRYGGASAEADVRVLPDPRTGYDSAARVAKLDASLAAGRLQDAVVGAIERIGSTRRDVEAVVTRAAEADAKARETAPANDEEAGGPHAGLIEAGRKLEKGLSELERTLWTPPGTRGIVEEKDAWSKVSSLARSLGSSFDAPTAAQLTYLSEVQGKVAEAIAAVNRFFEEQVAPFRAQVRDAGIGLLPEEEPLPAPGAP